MKVITVPNVNYALPHGFHHLFEAGIRETSRVGHVLRAPGPVCTVYSNPLQRVLFSASRDANPFFHLMEALWMLAGRNDVKFVSQYNSRMAEFSDDGEHQWGAYGFRWRYFFNFDQLEELIKMLRANPNTRRAVLTMWAPEGDLQQLGTSGGPDGKDVPCNTHCYFGTTNGALDLTVCCRSNDMVWGAYGANAVHFSMLLEFMAGATGLPVGKMYQFSNNFHIYEQRPDVVKLLDQPEHLLQDDRYANAGNFLVRPLGVELGGEAWLTACADFVSDPFQFEAQEGPGEAFFRDVAEPMADAWRLYKAGEAAVAMQGLVNRAPNDWLVAGYEWLQRRQAKKEAQA